jgi:hypothetical protein
MSYLRFSSEEYQALCRLAEQIPLERMAPSALQHFLLAHLPPQQLGLAKRIACLDHRQMQLLHEHLPGPNPDDATPDGWDGLTEEELEAVADVWDSFPYPNRFLRHFREPLVRLFSDTFPGLAQKLARMSEHQFTRLYEYVKGRGEANA